MGARRRHCLGNPWSAGGHFHQGHVPARAVCGCLYGVITIFGFIGFFVLATLKIKPIAAVAKGTVVDTGRPLREIICADQFHRGTVVFCIDSIR